MLFSVRACSSAQIALAETLGNLETNAYEIILGAYDNTQTFIRKQVGGDEAEEGNSVETPGILDCHSYRDFYISWNDGTIEVGSGHSSSHALLTWHDSNPHEIRDFAMATGPAGSGTWKFPQTSGEISQLD